MTSDASAAGMALMSPHSGLDGSLSWHAVSMAHVHTLLAFMANSVELNHLQEFGFNELFNNLLRITVADDDEDEEEEEEEEEEKEEEEERERKKKKKKEPAAQGSKRKHKTLKASASSSPKKRAKKTEGATAAATSDFLERQRSDMWTEWAKQVLRLVRVIGFAPVSYTRNDASTSAIGHIDTLRPVVLNMYAITRIDFRVSLAGDYTWRFFAHDNPRPLDNVIVLGTDFPRPQATTSTSSGLVLTNAMRNDAEVPILSSRVARVFNSSAYRLYRTKVQNAEVAETELARPTQVVQEVRLSFAQSAANDTVHAVDETRPNHCDPLTQAELRRGRVGGAGKADATAKGLGEESEALAQHVSFALPAGKELAAHRVLAQAPQDVLTARLAFLETACFAFDTPPDLVFTGDASGKVKLNQEATSPESARLFKVAQAALKSWVEKQIERMWFEMYGEGELTAALVLHKQRREEEREKKRKRKKKEKEGTEEEEEEEEEGDEVEPTTTAIDPDKLSCRLRSRIRASLPSRMPVQDVVLLFDKQMLRWEAAREILSGEYNMPPDTWSAKAPMTDLELEREKDATKLEMEREKLEMQMDIEQKRLKIQLDVEQQRLKMQEKQAAAAAAAKPKPAASSSSKSKAKSKAKKH